jgi:hypothetical protein
MLLFMSGAGKDCHDLTLSVEGAAPAERAAIHSHIKLIIEKCHNLLLFQQLEPTELVSYKI